MPERIRVLLAALLLVLVAGACRVDVEVGIDAEADGSGRVRVEVEADREVVEAVDLSKGLRTDDLQQAGWEVEGPTPRPEGGQRVVATKPFRTPDGARLVIEELTGADGPFQGFRLERTRTFARTTTRLAGTVDLAEGIEAFGDPGLRTALGGSDLGLDLAQLEKTAGASLDQVVGVQVVVRLPGAVEANAPKLGGDEARYEVPLRQRVELRAQSMAWNTLNLVGAGVAALALLGLLTLLLTGRRR